MKVNEGKDVFLFKKEDEVEYIPHFTLNLQVRWNKWGQGDLFPLKVVMK